MTEQSEREAFEAERAARRASEAARQAERQARAEAAWDALPYGMRLGVGTDVPTSPRPRDLLAPLRGRDGEAEGRVRVTVPRPLPLGPEAVRVTLGSSVRGSSLTRARHAARLPMRLRASVGDVTCLTECTHRDDRVCEPCKAAHGVAVEAARYVQATGRALRRARKAVTYAEAALRDGTDVRTEAGTVPAANAWVSATLAVASLDAARTEALALVVMPDRTNGERMARPSDATERACNVPPLGCPA